MMQIYTGEIFSTQDPGYYLEADKVQLFSTEMKVGMA